LPDTVSVRAGLAGNIGDVTAVIAREAKQSSHGRRRRV